MIRLGQFSLGWCIGMSFLHAAVTAALALLLFVGGMGSFTYGPGANHYVAKALMWIWSPFGMAAAEGESGIGLPAEGIALFWSLIVGVIAGFIAPIFSKPKIQEPLPPGINPDLVGTPWEQKAQIKFPTLREFQNKEHNEESTRAVPSHGDKPPN